MSSKPTCDLCGMSLLPGKKTRDGIRLGAPIYDIWFRESGEKMLICLRCSNELSRCDPRVQMPGLSHGGGQRDEAKGKDGMSLRDAVIKAINSETVFDITNTGHRVAGVDTEAAADAILAIVREALLSDAAVEEGRDILHPMPSQTNLRVRIMAALDAVMGGEGA